MVRGQGRSDRVGSGPMGLRDRLGLGSRKGVPGRAVVVVNRTGGRDSGTSSIATLLRARLKPVPEGSGPEADISQMLSSKQVHLITAGMEIPAVLDPESNQPIGISKEGLDEAIGRHYLALEPEHGDWERALKAKQKELKKAEGPLGPIREHVGDVRDLTDAARAAPGGLRDAARTWKKEVKKLGGESHPAGDPVEGVSFDDWVGIRVALSREGTPASEASAYAEHEGVPSGRWDAINSTWEQQIAWNMTAKSMYEKAMAEAGGQ